MTASAVFPGDEQALCHIVPLGDFKEHEPSLGCWSHPRPHEDRSDLIMHNAMDQRERYASGELRLQ